MRSRVEKTVTLSIRVEEILKDWNRVAILQDELVKLAEVHDRAELAIGFRNYKKREAPRGSTGRDNVLFKHVSSKAICDLAVTMRHPLGRHVT